jgi:hypothetical protein
MCDVLLCVQTSAASISFTYDSWSTIISSLQRMSDSGSFLDRKSFCHSTASSSTSSASKALQHMHIDSPHPSHTSHTSTARTSEGGTTAIQNVATSLILRGPDAAVGASRVVCCNSAYPTRTSGIGSSSGSDMHEAQTRSIIGGGKSQDSSAVLPFASSYPTWTSSDQSANGTVLYSQHLTNGYQRSACLLSNGQAILPSLQV